VVFVCDVLARLASKKKKKTFPFLLPPRSPPEVPAARTAAAVLSVASRADPTRPPPLSLSLLFVVDDYYALLFVFPFCSLKDGPSPPPPPFPRLFLTPLPP
jgi:hypothetical protein